MSTSGLPSIGQALSASLQAVIDATRRLDELSTARVIGEAADAVHKLQKGGQPLGTISPAAITLESSGIKVESGPAAPVAYTAPEKLKGTAGDRRSDVFSLGVVLWEALAHARLFEGATDEDCKWSVLACSVQPPSELNANVPAELDAICKKALARDPADRYQSAKVMAAEISAVLDDAGYPETNEQIAKYLEQAFPAGAAAGAALAAKLAAAPAAAAARPNPNATTLGLAPIRDPEQRTKQPSGHPIKETFPGVGEAPHLTPSDAPPSNKTSILGSLPSDPATKTSGKQGTLPPPNVLVSPAPAVKAAATIVDTIPPTTTPTRAPATIVDTIPPASAAAKVAPAKLDPGKTAILGSLTSVPEPAKPVEAAKPAAAPTPTGTTKPDEAVPWVEKPKPLEPTKLLVPKPFAAKPVGAAPPPVAAKPATIATAETVATPALPPSTAGIPTVVAASSSGVVGLPSLPPGASLPAAADDDFTPGEGRAPEPTLLPDRPSAKEMSPAPPIDPTDAVSLPRHRDSGVVRDPVDGWGWKSDSHDVIDDGHYDEDEKQTARKRLFIAIGGAVGAIALILIIAMIVGGGGDDDKKKDPQKKTDVAESSTGQSRTAPEPSPAPAVEPAAVPAVTEPAAVEEPKVEPAVVEPPKVEPAIVEPPKVEPAKVEPPKVEPAKVEPPKVEPAKVEPPKVEPPKTAIKTEPPKAVKTEPPKTAIKKTETSKKKEPKVARTSGAKPIDPYAAPDKPKVDPAAAYKTGFQQYVRGDTAGALATFKGSLASNPSFAPTWRGLGLVYEKMGQKSDAKRSFRRYLQLSPSANDADQIKERMERL